jgi:alpha-N-arabinofuranosidase
MKMYNVHQDASLIPIELHSPWYTYDEKSVAALSASVSKDKNELIHISLVNIDAKQEYTVEMDLNELGIHKITGTILTSSNLQDHNTFDRPNTIIPKLFNDFEIKKNHLSLKIPAFSVIVLEGK